MSLIVLGNQALSIILCVADLLRRVFLGRLRSGEEEALYESLGNQVQPTRTSVEK